MELEPPLAVYTAALLAALALILFSYHFRRRRQNLPPGPKPWPIIGNLNLIGPLPHRSIHEISQKYGPIIQLHFGSVPVIVASSVEMAKQFLKTHDQSFASRPKVAAGKYTSFNYSIMTWSPYGPYWRFARKIYLTELLSAKRLESTEYIRVEEMHALLYGLYASSGKPITVRDHLWTTNIHVISRMVLGKKFLDDMEKSIITREEFKKMFEEWFLLNGVLNIGDFIPWIAFLDLQGYVKRMKVLGKKFDWFLEQVLHEHEVRRDGVEDSGSKDMVDVLLQLADDPNLEVKMDRTNAKALTQELIAGATESSAVTIEWALSELLKNPTIFKRATEELDKVIGKERWVKEKDSPDLPYIEAIMKETMRLHPVVPLITPHQAQEDCEVAGYKILAGTRVHVNTWTIGRDPMLWDAPNEFHPERFMEKAVDVKGQDFELLPFGSGRRMCPGYVLALKMVQSILGNLIHGFVWKLPDKMKPEDLNMEEVYWLSTPRKIPLLAVVEP